MGGYINDSIHYDTTLLSIGQLTPYYPAGYAGTPERQCHFTHAYSIVLDRGDNGPERERSRESRLHLKQIKDPDYYGFITFEMPDKLFVYTADDSMELNTEQVERLIEFLSDFRSNPGLWKNGDI